MKRSVLLIILFSVPTFSQSLKNNFPLTVHITRVDMQQGIKAVSGSGTSDQDGKYSSQVSGGESYLYHIFTVRIDGDNREFKMTVPKVRPIFKRSTILHIGDYRGRWNKNGSLEIEFMTANGKEEH